MTAAKTNWLLKSHYNFSFNRNTQVESEGYLGFIEGNLTGSEFEIYDQGKDPFKTERKDEWRH